MGLWIKTMFKKKYIITDGIVKFDINESTVKKVVEFYTEAPFPNYAKLDDKSSINSKGEKKLFSSWI